jgi:hypothetical protein
VEVKNKNIMEIDLLKHSKYDQTKLVESKAFLLKLVEKITDTYELEISRSYNRDHSTYISLFKEGRIPSVFLRVNGEADISFNVRYCPPFQKRDDEARLWKDKGKENYVVDVFNTDISITIRKITKDNFNDYLGDMVKLIELKGHTLRR